MNGVWKKNPNTGGRERYSDLAVVETIIVLVELHANNVCHHKV